MKTPDQMTTSELLEADRVVGLNLDNVKYGAPATWVRSEAKRLLGRRREIREELDRRRTIVDCQFYAFNPCPR